MKRIGVTMAVLAILATGGLLLRSQEKNDPVQDLRTKVQQLEARVQKLEQYAQMTSQNRLSANLRTKIGARFAQDRQNFTKQKLDEIETLFMESQKVGVWNTPQAVEKLKKVVSMFPSSNRAGCAYLDLGRLASGNEREQYFTKAIAEYSDSVYLDMVQVGAYARFLLATDYLKSGRKAEAEEMFNIIRAQYPDAVDHYGLPLAPQIPK